MFDPCFGRPYLRDPGPIPLQRLALVLGWALAASATAVHLDAAPASQPLIRMEDLCGNPIFDSGRTSPELLAVQCARQWTPLDSLDNESALPNPLEVPLEDPQPPSMGWMIDENGDGRADAVILRYRTPPRTQPPLSFRWPAGPGSHVLERRVGLPWSLVGSDSTLRHVPLDSPFTSGVTGTPAGLTELLGFQETSTRYAFPLRDSVPPVILSATIRYSTDSSVPDTLNLRFSEPLSTFDPLSLRSSMDGTGPGTPFTNVGGRWHHRSREVMVLLDPLVKERPERGRWVRLATPLVTDSGGTSSDPVAFYARVEGNRRIIPTRVTLTNPIVRPSGTFVGQGPFDLVGLAPTPGSPGTWSPLAHPRFPGTTLPGTYTPEVDDGDPSSGSDGVTVIAVTTNLPLTIDLWIYDMHGVAVADLRLEVDEALLATAPRNALGEASLGIVWRGLDAHGSEVGTGVYLVRLLTQRPPTREEMAEGIFAGFVDNTIHRVGVQR